MVENGKNDFGYLSHVSEQEKLLNPYSATYSIFVNHEITIYISQYSNCEDIIGTDTSKLNGRRNTFSDV